METSQNTLLYHDDREAQMLLQRIKEKMARMRPMRENASERIQPLELKQEDKKCNN